MFYKIVFGYKPEEYLEITKDEVQKAYYCFLEKKDSIFSGGAIKGSNIQRIEPDYHRTMGWNRGYELQNEDYIEIRRKGLDEKMRNFLEMEQKKVGYLIATNQTHLIGKSFEMPKIEMAPKIKQLSEKMKV